MRWIRDGKTGRFAGQRTAWLNAKQAKLVRRLWLSGVPCHQIAGSLGITYSTLRARLSDQLKDLPRRGRGAGGGHQPREPADPTPEQIAERAAAVRQSWSEEERELRWVGRFTRSEAEE